MQVENEYGSFSCEHKYTYWLKDLTQHYVNTDALLYTTDGTYESMVSCGHINGTVQSVDFGAVHDVPNQFKVLRKYYPRGPLINSEFYAGWLSHWQDDFPAVPAESVAHTLNDMLRQGVNVNFYMFFGGTNFGFTSGANVDPNYRPQTTSYDYDAPISEAGDVTGKYWAIRNVTSKYVKIEEVPENSRKLSLPPIVLDASAQLMSDVVRSEVCKVTRSSSNPATFEQFNQKGGLVIYETELPKNFNKDPEILNVTAINDRGLVFIDRSFVGVLSRENAINTVAFSPNGQKLQIIVEDQGRVNYGPLDKWKGIGGVKIGGKLVRNWNSTSCPLDDVQRMSRTVRRFAMSRKRFSLTRGPTFFVAEFNLTESQVLDTFMDLTGWSKGIAFVNGINLGRYWSTVKPQRTLYVPKEYLQAGGNEIILLEFQACHVNRTVTFIDHPLL